MGSFRIGKIFGIPIQLNATFLLLLLLLLFTRGLSGVTLLLVTFLSVLVHELGHALTARRLNVPTLGIELHFFGGAARMARMPDTPREEILIAAAGPAVSLAIALVGGLLALISGFSGFAYLALINLILGGFNLLPALPMDGGRIFRALLSRRLGRLRATAVAVKVARSIAVGLGALGLFSLNFFLVGLAVVLWLMAGAELRAAQLFQQTVHWPADRLAHLTRTSNAEMEVLDQHGRPLAGFGRSEPGERSPSMGELRVERLRSSGRQRWVVRDAHGRILLVAEHPLHW